MVEQSQKILAVIKKAPPPRPYSYSSSLIVKTKTDGNRRNNLCSISILLGRMMKVC